MTISLLGIPASISTLIQNGTLERVHHDSLLPRLLYRGESIPEKWEANLGESQTFTRNGIPKPRLDPLQPGQDPVPSTTGTEQWRAEAAQYGGTNDTHMPTSHVSMASQFLRNTQNLGLEAAITMNRLVRNRLFAAYLAGEAMATAAAAIGTRMIAVSTLNGFTEALNEGALQYVNPANPLAVSFTTVGEPDNEITGFSPADPRYPLGPGVIVLANALVAGVAVRDGVKAATRSRRMRVGGGATVDSLTSGSILTLDSIIAGVTRLRDSSVPPHADGTYHVHITPTGEQQIFADNHWQRIHDSLGEGVAYADYAIGRKVGCTFYRNSENPTVSTVSRLVGSPGGAGGAQLASELGGEVTNESGVAINRALITGGGVCYEKYLDESKYITEAGVQGKVGNFTIVNGGVAIMTERIRYILKAGGDRLGQMVNQTWSWSGDFPSPSDALSGDAARYKRAVVLEHG